MRRYHVKPKGEAVRVKCAGCGSSIKISTSKIKKMPRFYEDDQWHWKTGCGKCHGRIVISKKNMPEYIYRELEFDSNGKNIM